MSQTKKPSVLLTIKWSHFSLMSKLHLFFWFHLNGFQRACKMNLPDYHSLHHLTNQEEVRL